MKHSKVAIIGAGRVGTTAAYALLLQNYVGEILLVDINPKQCQGELLDLSDTLSFSTTSKIKVANYQEAATADIIIITAGKAQEPGQSRTELTLINKKIIISIMEQLTPLNENACILMVTNPVDIMTYYAQKYCSLNKNQIFGSGTFLDSQRLCGALSKKLGIAEQSINAYVLGEHGDTQFPAWSCAQAGGVPIQEFPSINQKELDELAQESKEKAYKIIDCKGATFYGIGACIASICESILFDQKRIILVSTYNAEYDVCFSVPTILGQAGVEQQLPIPLDPKEQKQLIASAMHLKNKL